MKTKVLLLIFCIIFGLSTANAEFEAINQDNPTDNVLAFIDFSKAEIIHTVPTHQIKLPIKTNPLDKEAHHFIENQLKLANKFSQIWSIGDVIVDCDTQKITSQNWQIIGKTANTDIINISQKYHFSVNAPKTHKINFNDYTDNLTFQKACKLNSTLTK